MNCLLCGEVCNCVQETASVPPPRWVTDAAVDQASAGEAEGEPGTDTTAVVEHAAAEGSLNGAPASNVQTEETAAWRDELANRLSSYRARRRPRPPRYPSLRLAFDQPVLKASAPQNHALDSLRPISQDALALDSFRACDPNIAEAETAPVSPANREHASAVSQTPTAGPQTNSQYLAQRSAKIIEFPRFASAAPPLSLNELAEPVLSRPRILDVPDAVPPPPALGGITIESAQLPAAEKRPGIDIPLQSAPLMRRVIASAIDAAIAVMGCTASGFIFWKIAGVRPPRFQILSMASVAAVLLWALYQYLLIVYAGSTPGLRLAKLELNCFSGKPVSKSRRRWRVLASYLSALSLGMGYAWVFLDEDCLCWHDRITRTYLAPKASTSASQRSL